MADDSGKVTIVLDLDNSSFKAKGEESKSVFDGIEHAGSGAMNKVALGVMSLNQALELGEKLIEGFEKAFEAMEHTEGINNQRVALQNLTDQIGVDSAKVTEAIVKTTGGTVTHVEAMQSAMKLLQAGIRAENIPAMAAFAEQIEKTSGGTVKFQSVIDSLAMSVDTGMTRSLRQFGISVKETGDRLQLQQAIIDQTNAKIKTLGTGYDETAAKIATRMKEAGEAITHSIGQGLLNIGFSVFASDTEKAEKSLKSLETQLTKIDESVAKGQKQFELWDPATSTMKWVDAETKRAAIEKQIAELKGQVSEATAKEHEENEKLNASLKQTGEIVKPLTDAEKARVELIAKRSEMQRRAEDEESEYDAVSLATAKNMQSVKQSLLDKEYSEEKANILSKIQSKQATTDQLIALEERYYEKTNALRTSDDDFKRAQDAAELKYVEANLLTLDGARDRENQIELSKETQLHNQKMEMIRMEGLEESQLNMKMEQEEVRHQQALARTKQQFEAVNMNNLKAGMGKSLGEMKKQFGSFTNFTASATTKTHSIMTKGFVDLAKGHGDAMQKMLGQFLEMIGTQMIESGVFHMLQGAATFNAEEAGMGAALVAAGGALVGASGGGSDSGASATTGGGGFGSEPVTSTPTQPGMATPDQQPQKKASIVINGDFLNSRETANHLAEVLRQNSDITDYSITAQGKNYGT